MDFEYNFSYFLDNGYMPSTLFHNELLYLGIGKELEKDSTVANFATVQNESGRMVTRNIDYYNLDVIIFVGYRVKTKEGTKFSQRFRIYYW